jgi:hypothetical protein
MERRRPRCEAWPVEPTEAQLERAVTALVPFVQEWRLSLNPEDLEEMAYAVLTHANTDLTDEAIDAAVRAQIEEARRRADAMYRDEPG